MFGFEPAAGRLPAGVTRFHAHAMPAGRPQPGEPHAHDFISLAYFEVGGGRLALDDHRWEVEAGDLFVIPPGQVVASDPPASATSGPIGWGVFFHPEAFGSDLSGTRLTWRAHPMLFPFVGGAAGERGVLTRTAQRLRVPEDDRPSWTARVAALADELAHPGDGHHEAVRAHLTLLLVAVARLTGPPAGDLRVSDDPLLADVFEVIEQQYAEGISLADVAAAVSLTPGHLTTAVRQETGRTVLEWITERRMIEARRLLVQTDLPVQAVARRVGYADPAYFTRIFRRNHDTTPSAWRRATPG